MKVEKQLEAAGVPSNEPKKKTTEGCRIEKKLPPNKKDDSANDGWDQDAELIAQPVLNEGPIYEMFDQMDNMQKQINQMRGEMAAMGNALTEVIDHLKKNNVAGYTQVKTEMAV